MKKCSHPSIKTSEKSVKLVPSYQYGYENDDNDIGWGSATLNLNKFRIMNLVSLLLTLMFLRGHYHLHQKIKYFTFSIDLPNWSFKVYRKLAIETVNN